MKKIGAKHRRSDCPVNVALQALGDEWSLLIVRDLMFMGRKTYKEFLQGGERIATNILADRLRRLESLGIISKRRDPSDARRYVYRLTEAGLGLAPVLAELILWSARHFETAAPPETLEEIERHRSRFLSRVRNDWEAAKNARESRPPRPRRPR